MQRGLLLLVCISVCVNCFSQQYPFIHYTPREGLINNRTKFIYQDSKGKLYISTYGGLNIYDGSRFVNYNSNNGLALNLVNEVVEMGEDSIWIVTNTNKIHCLVHGVLKDFVAADRYTPLINRLIKASDGYYYAASDEGLFRLQNKRFTPIALQTTERPKTLTQVVEVDKKLYMLYNPDYKLPYSQLLVYDLQRQQLVAYFKNIQASHLFYSDRGGIWICTARGLFLMNRFKEAGDSLNLQPVSSIFHLPADLYTYYICKDQQSNTWIASAQGVYRIHPGGEITRFTVDNGLTTNNQTSIFNDHENNIWFTNELTGLTKLSNQHLAFYKTYKPGFDVSDVSIPSLSDSVWLHDINHHRAIVVLPDGSTREYSNPGEPIGYPSTLVFGDKNKWVLNGVSIYRWRMDPSAQRYSLALAFKDSSRNIGGFAAIDNNGNLVSVSERLLVLAGKKVLTAPLSYLADQAAIDKNNRIWVATRSNSLFCFQLSGSGDNTTLSLLKLFSQTIVGSPRSIAADRNGNIWIGTRDQGLYCLHFDNLELKSIRELTIQNGLSENFVNYLFCDKDNNIWACTPSGLDEVTTDKSGHFQVENVTGSSNLYLPVYKVQQTKKGMLWILSAAGVITYNPEHTTVSNWKPALSFAQVFVNNIPEAVIANKQLKYSQNNIIFQLSAPSFVDEKQTRFSYLLEGSGNDSWSLPSANASVNFANLPPGEYTLKAKAIFLNGLYPDAESCYSFTVLPPWWQTTWFRLLAAVLVVGFLFISVQFYFKRKLQVQTILLEKKQAIEKERTRIATDMHDDLGAGLSRIKFLSETIGMKKQQHLPIEEEINSIRSYSHEMIDKMGEIVWALNEKNDSLEDLLSYTRAYAVEYLQENGIHCKVEEPDIIPGRMVSGEFRRNVYLTVKETLHNIVKHAQATEVLMRIEINHDLSIEILDNGIGMDPASAGAGGNGLPNMSTRVGALKGSFAVSSEGGTKISIKVPLDV